MSTMFTRRSFLKSFSPAPAMALMPAGLWPSKRGNNQARKNYKLKLSLNVYSFHRPLTNGDIDLFDVLDFCASHNFDAIDPTGYYFPGYPEVPDEDYIREFKRKAFLQGLDISGTGIRNDFANPDSKSRQNDILLIRQWIEVAAKIGAPVLRIFAGHHHYEGYEREAVFQWIADDIRTCCVIAEKYGVLIALQNHNGFLKTADDVIRLLKLVDSDWLGLNLDIGSYRQYPPYDEIQRNIHLAITWQIKENVWIDGRETPTDFSRLVQMIKDAGYRGYLPLETLGSGDPFEKVPVLLEKVRNAIEKE